MHTTHAETIKVGAMGIRFLVESGQSNRSLTVFECDVPAEATMPAPHSHDAFDETIYGLQGVTTWTVDGAAIEIRPGDAICIPHGVVHGFTNGGGVDARFLAIATPGVFGPAYFREIGDVLSADGPPDLAAIADVMHRHGLTPAPPAGA